MRKNMFSLALKVTVICLILSPAAVKVVFAEMPLKYSCSNQIYQAFDKEKIDVFSRITGIKVEVAASSSGSAVNRLMHDYSDIASSSRSLHRTHSERGYAQVPVCKDPLAVIVRSQCSIENLTDEQLQDIFSGKVKNWKALGGPDLPVRVIVPGSHTAANKNFRRLVMKHMDLDYDFMTWDSTMAAEAVKYFPCGSVSFIASGAVIHQKELKSIRINGLAPSHKDYPYYQIFYYITKGEATGSVKKFLEFSASDEARAIMERNGMVPISN